LKRGKELDADHLPQPLGNPEIRLAMEVLKKMSQNTIESLQQLADELKNRLTSR
jgi:hypothetical protein